MFSKIRNMDPQKKRSLEFFPILCMAWLFYALDGSVISVLQTNTAWNAEFNIDSQKLGLFSLFPSVGALISVVGIGPIIPKYIGRKWAFQFATFLVVFGVILQTFTGNWGAVLVGRIVMGYGGDLNGLVLGYYVTEVAPKNVRGRSLILVQQFSSSFIAIAGYWIAYAISYLPQDKSYSWKVAQSLQFAPALLFFVLVFRLPESPRWLAAKYPNDDMPLLKSLSYIRNYPTDHPDVVSEAQEIRDYQIWASENESTSIFNILKEKRLAQRVGYAMVPLLQQQLCGVGVLTIYAAVIYEQLGLSTQHNALLLNACTQILYAAAALGSSYFVEKIGRRTCILSSSVAQTIGLVCISGLAVGTAGNSSTNTVANGFVAAFIILNTTIYWLLGTGPCTVYINEIMPTQCRELGVGIANAIPVGLGVALGQQWPSATAAIGAKSYLILLATCAFSTVLVYFFVKEPKGLSIERIDALFGEKDHIDEFRETHQDGKAKHSLEDTGGQEAHNPKRDGDVDATVELVEVARTEKAAGNDML